MTYNPAVSAIEFEPWPKIARLNRDIVVTEKIDGTNAAIQIVNVAGLVVNALNVTEFVGPYAVVAQSRNKIITPDADNYGFARWVQENAVDLVTDLGEGTHFGEWWGQGIQRRYDLSEKRFSLFNTARYADAEFVTPRLRVVPVLYQGPWNLLSVGNALEELRQCGSYAAPGFQDPEGVVVFHTASRTMFKVTIRGDEAPKSLA